MDEIGNRSDELTEQELAMYEALRSTYGELPESSADSGYVCAGILTSACGANGRNQIARRCANPALMEIKTFAYDVFQELGVSVAHLCHQCGQRPLFTITRMIYDENGASA